jgi:hypothetical protein
VVVQEPEHGGAHGSAPQHADPHDHIQRPMTISSS